MTRLYIYPQTTSNWEGQRPRCPQPPKSSYLKNSTITSVNFHSSKGLSPEVPGARTYYTKSPPLAAKLNLQRHRRMTRIPGFTRTMVPFSTIILRFVASPSTVSVQFAMFANPETLP